jgi:DNA-binding CsgD family transcriptional regulator
MNREALLKLADAVGDLNKPTDVWLHFVTHALLAARPEARAVVACEVFVRGGEHEFVVARCAGERSLSRVATGLWRALGDAERSRVFGVDASSMAAVELFGGELPAPLRASFDPAGLCDGLLLTAGIEESRALAIATLETAAVDPEDALQLMATARALQAALAMRRALDGARISAIARAVFRSDRGALPAAHRKETSGEPAHSAPITALCDRARPPERTEPDSLTTWKALTGGYLRMVRQLDDEGERLIVLAPSVPAPDPLRALTPVEARIASMAGQAMSNKEIGFALHISESAAENHLSRAMRKMQVADRLMLVTLYTQLERSGEV